MVVLAFPIRHNVVLNYPWQFLLVFALIAADCGD